MKQSSLDTIAGAWTSKSFIVCLTSCWPLLGLYIFAILLVVAASVMPCTGSAPTDVVVFLTHAVGSSVGIDQSVFAILEDTFLSLSTGTIWQLNNTPYITFNRSLDGMVARNYYGVGANQTLQYVNPATFYNGSAGLDYQEIAAPATARPSNATSNSTKAVYAEATQAWTKVVERLYYYTELVTLQASTTTPCSNDSRSVTTLLNSRASDLGTCWNVSAVSKQQQGFSPCLLLALLPTLLLLTP